MLEINPPDSYASNSRGQVTVLRVDGNQILTPIPYTACPPTTVEDADDLPAGVYPVERIKHYLGMLMESELWANETRFIVVRCYVSIR